MGCAGFLILIACGGSLLRIFIKLPGWLRKWDAEHAEAIRREQERQR